MEFNDPNWWHRSSFWLEGPSTESRSIGADLSGGKETSTYLLVCEMRRQAGTRTGNWLTKQQAEALIQAPDIHTLKGKRDRAILALLIGTGLRRSEASALTFDHIQQREGRWAIVDLRGKGNRIRTVPMPSWTKAYIDVWTAAAGLSTGYVFRPLNNRHELTRNRLLEQNLMEMVMRYGKQIGVPKLACHDLRRTFAKLAHHGHSPLEQLQLSLGHATILTTERYLGVKQNLTDAPCDFLGLQLAAARSRSTGTVIYKSFTGI